MGIFRRNAPLVEGWRGGKALLLVSLGDRVVWDGRRSVFLQAPVARSSSRVEAAGLSVSSVLSAPVVESYAQTQGSGEVSSSAALELEPAAASADVPAVELVVSQSLTMDTARADATSHDGEAESTYDAILFLPTADAEAAAPDPELVVSSELAAPVAASFADGHNADGLIGVDGQAEAASSESSVVDPVVAVGSSLSVPVVSASAAALAPDLSVGSVLDVPVAAASAAAPEPAVQALALQRQRMNKNGDWESPAGWTVPATGWTSNATYPAVIESNASLVVQGGGSALIGYSFTFAGNSADAYIYLNETRVKFIQMAFGSPESGTVAVTVSAGDKISFRKADFYGVLKSGGYLEVMPA